MCESIFTMYDTDGTFLLAVDIFKFYYIGAFPGYVSVVNVCVKE